MIFENVHLQIFGDFSAIGWLQEQMQMNFIKWNICEFIFATSYSRKNKRMRTFSYSIIFLLSHKTIWKLYFLAYQAGEHQYESCGLMQKMSREASNSTKIKPLNAYYTVSNIRNNIISDRSICCFALFGCFIFCRNCFGCVGNC